MRSTKSCFSTQPMQGALCSSKISRSALTLIFWSTSEVKGFKSVGGLGYLSSQTVSSFLDRRCSSVCAYRSMHGFGQCLSSHATLRHRRHVGWIAALFCSCLVAYLAYLLRGQSHGHHLRHIFLDDSEGIAEFGFFVLGGFAERVDGRFHLVSIRSFRSIQHPIQRVHAHLARLSEDTDEPCTRVHRGTDASSTWSVILPPRPSSHLRRPSIVSLRIWARTQYDQPRDPPTPSRHGAVHRACASSTRGARRLGCVSTFRRRVDPRGFQRSQSKPT